MSASQLLFDRFGSDSVATSLSVLDVALTDDDVPQSLPAATRLAALDLHNNQLTAVPTFTFGAPLERLDLSRNRIAQLIPELCSLQSLTDLCLHHNELTLLPRSIYGLCNLTSLNVSDNMLIALPSSMMRLTALRSLNCARNRLRTLWSGGTSGAGAGGGGGGPTDRGGGNATMDAPLPQLESADFDSNPLSCLPPVIGMLTSLRVLRVADTKMLELPLEIGNLRRLEVLSLPVCLQTPPTEMVRKGVKAILKFATEHGAESMRCRANFVVLGGVGSGKRSLVSALGAKKRAKGSAGGGGGTKGGENGVRDALAASDAVLAEQWATWSVELSAQHLLHSSPPRALRKSPPPSSKASLACMFRTMAASVRGSVLASLGAVTLNEHVVPVVVVDLSQETADKCAAQVREYAPVIIARAGSAKPCAVLVGTHADACKSDDDAEERLSQIAAAVPGVFASAVAVNTSSRRDAGTLRTVLTEAAVALPGGVRRTVTKRDLALEVALDKARTVMLQSNTPPVLTFEQLRKLAYEQAHIASSSTLLSAVRALHADGALVHYADAEAALARCVVLDYRWLVCALLPVFGEQSSLASSAMLFDGSISRMRRSGDYSDTPEVGLIDSDGGERAWRPPLFPARLHAAVHALLVHVELATTLARRPGVLLVPALVSATEPRAVRRQEERAADERRAARGNSPIERVYVCDASAHLDSLFAVVLCRLANNAKRRSDEMEVSDVWRDGALLTAAARAVCTVRRKFRSSDVRVRADGAAADSIQLCVNTCRALAAALTACHITYTVHLVCPSSRCRRQLPADALLTRVVAQPLVSAPLLSSLVSPRAAASKRVASGRFGDAFAQRRGAAADVDVGRCEHCDGAVDYRRLMPEAFVLPPTEACSVPVIEDRELSATKSLSEGDGGAARVSLAVWSPAPDGEAGHPSRSVVIKQLVADDTLVPEDLAVAADEFQREVALLNTLHHPCLVNLLAVCRHPPTLVIEHIAMGSLQDVLANPLFIIMPALRCRLAFDIARGVVFLHSHAPPILHRDLKSPNVLVNDRDAYVKGTTAKLADFGTSEREGARAERVGTALWMAPEVLESKPCGTASDVYSFALILWELCHRETPYASDQNSDLFAFQAELDAAVLAGHRPMIDNERCSVQWASVIEACWAAQPDDRPSMRVILDVICELGAACEPQLGTLMRDMAAERTTTAATPSSRGARRGGTPASGRSRRDGMSRKPSSGSGRATRERSHRSSGRRSQRNSAGSAASGAPALRDVTSDDERSGGEGGEQLERHKRGVVRGTSKSHRQRHSREVTRDAAASRSGDEGGGSEDDGRARRGQSRRHRRSDSGGSGTAAAAAAVDAGSGQDVDAQSLFERRMHMLATGSAMLPIDEERRQHRDDGRLLEEEIRKRRAMEAHNVLVQHTDEEVMQQADAVRNRGSDAFDPGLLYEKLKKIQR